MERGSLVNRLYKLGAAGITDATNAADKIEQLWSAYCYSEAHASRLMTERDAAKLDVEALEISHGEVIERLRAALLVAVRQNEHDMLMTGDELRSCRATLAGLGA